MIELKNNGTQFYVEPADVEHKEDLIRVAKPLTLIPNQPLQLRTGIRVSISEDYEECWIITGVDPYNTLGNKDIYDNLPFLHRRYTKNDSGKEIILEGISFNPRKVIIPKDTIFSRVFHSFMTMNDRVLDLSKNFKNNVIYKDDNFILCSTDGNARIHNLITDVATGKSYYKVPVGGDSKVYLKFSIESEDDDEQSS